jgi:hypothetical protein
VFPLLWTREKGFDYKGYSKLMAEADFFGLSELKEWILEKKYMAAVETGLKMQIHPGQLNPLTEERHNHRWLHSLPTFPNDEELHHRHADDVDNRVTRLVPPLKDPLSEDVELVSCKLTREAIQGDFSLRFASRVASRSKPLPARSCEYLERIIEMSFPLPGGWYLTAALFKGSRACSHQLHR